MLLLVLDGDVSVRRGQDSPRTVSPKTFLGEMRLLAGESANATVTAESIARLHLWSHTELEALEALRPNGNASILAVLGRDLTAKLRPIGPNSH